MKKYDKILIAIIVLLFIATIFSMALGIMCYESSASEMHIKFNPYNGKYEWDGTWDTIYGYGGFSIASMVFSLAAFIFVILTLIKTKNKKRNLISIGTLISTLTAWAMSIVAILEDGVAYSYEWYYNGFIYAERSVIRYEEPCSLWIIAFICLSVVLILSCVYLGVSETARKRALQPQQNSAKKSNYQPAPQQNVENVTQKSQRLAIDQGVIELKSLKSLLDGGILTQDEFDAQKSKLFRSMGITVQAKADEKPQQATYIGNYVNENGIILSLNGDKFAIRKPNDETVLTGSYAVDHTAQRITLTRDNGGTMRLQIQDENHLVDGAQQVYAKK